MKVQFINDAVGKTQFVVLPIEEYQRLAQYDSQMPVFEEVEEDEDGWVEVEYEKDEYDQLTIPHEVVAIKVEKQVSTVAAWRLYRGLTQAQVQALTGISQANLSQIEKQGNKPQSKTLQTLAEVYDCEPEQLLD